MTAHIDTLKEWWETAEVGDPKDGDVIIEWAGDGHAVRTFLEAERDDLYAACTYRILARATKPKPTWHDAPAVTAKGREDWDHVEAFSRNDDYDPPRWIDNQGITYTAEQLSDVTPLIEAKVTDETARTVLDRYYETETGHDWPEDTIALMRLAVTAALGLESV